jgi:GH15 family glucan-1,4-alpha-glucosidase
MADARVLDRVHQGSEAVPGIEDYGMVGDCRSAALVSRDGSIDWLCWPRFDSAPVFARLLDSRGGSFVIQPLGAYTAEREYVPLSNTLVTRFRTPRGVLQLTDVMFACGEAFKRRNLLPQSMLIRRLEALEGDVDVRLTLRPTDGFGLKPANLRQRGRGSYTFTVADGTGHLASDFELGAAGGVIGATGPLHLGEPKTAILSWNEYGPAVFPPLHDAERLIDVTNVYWRSWASRIKYDGPYTDAVVRSALALKLMTFAPSGAMVAAPTSSLPEKLGAEYNWDYRFCWLRDASFTIRAFYGLGLEEEAQSFLQWLLHTTHLTLPRLQVVYSVFGRDLLPERELQQLEGYRGSRPVRLGNQAYVQTQLDIYGEVMHAAVLAREHGVQFSGDERSFLQHLTRYVLQHWYEPDNGIWESRSDFTHHVHSKAMCWLALTSAARLAREGELKLDVARCEQVAAAIRQEVGQRGVHRAGGYYIAAYDGEEVDSALLVLPLIGFEDVRSSRMAATVAAIRRDFGRDDLLYRHMRGLQRREGAFVLSAFWLVECLALAGEVDEARQMFEKLLARLNDVGLYAEEIDPDTGVFLGNFPQGFSHMGLINAALALQEAARGKRGVQ